MWFHGSPLKLDKLLIGSSITQDEKLAQIFSFKPSIVSVEDDGTIKHDGKLKGRIYQVIDEVTPDDIYEHPRSAWKKGWEWLTKKEFKLEFLYEVTPAPNEILTEDEIRELKERHSTKK